MKFKDKVVVITGGNSGIGLACAHEFLREGARVAIFGRNRETLTEAATALGADALAVQGDVANLADLDRLYAEVRERFGRIDHLVVNAGVAMNKHMLEVDEAFFDWHFDINAKGAFFTVQKAVPLFPEQGGTVVLTGSVVHFRGWADFTVYSASKAALRAFARTMARDLLDRHIRVNIVSPGGVASPMIGRMGFDTKDMDEWAQTVPLKRYGTSEEMAKAIAFLSSDDAAYILGTDLLVDGGVGELDM